MLTEIGKWDVLRNGTPIMQGYKTEQGAKAFVKSCVSPWHDDSYAVTDGAITYTAQRTGDRLKWIRKEADHVK